ncbi:GntR family transcriptional regulator [Pseudomonas putida]|uniref:GntR family transcriptional regulator n=1 Tax=Pseudomonas putida TaxID=303 RepID=UPI00383A7911
MPRSARSTETVEVAVKEPRQTLVDTVYLFIRQQLNLGKWRPGDRILDYQIAEDFQCTRMPVRQAMLRLVNEGFLEGTSRGFRVPVLTDAQIRDVFEARRILEPAAAAMVARAGDAQLAEQLNNAIEIAKTAIVALDSDIMFTANAAFRRAWLSQVQNKRVLELIENLADHANQVRFSNVRDVANFGVTVVELKKLAAALTSGCAETAQQAVYQFLVISEEFYFKRRDG